MEHKGEVGDASFYQIIRGVRLCPSEQGFNIVWVDSQQLREVVNAEHIIPFPAVSRATKIQRLQVFLIDLEVLGRIGLYNYKEAEKQHEEFHICERREIKCTLDIKWKSECTHLIPSQFEDLVHPTHPQLLCTSLNDLFGVKTLFIIISSVLVVESLVIYAYIILAFREKAAFQLILLPGTMRSTHGPFVTL